MIQLPRPTGSPASTAQTAAPAGGLRLPGAEGGDEQRGRDFRQEIKTNAKEFLNHVDKKILRVDVEFFQANINSEVPNLIAEEETPRSAVIVTSVKVTIGYSEQFFAP